MTTQGETEDPQRIDCDLIAVSSGWNPNVHLHSQSGAKPVYDDAIASFIPGQSRQAEVSIGAARRLNSNLVDALARIAPRSDGLRIAEGIAALIDGLYIRRALKDGTPDPASAIALVEDYVDTQLTVLENRR